MSGNGQNIKVVVYDIPPSNNKYLGNSRKTIVYRLDKKYWANLILQATNDLEFTKVKKAIVTITYYFGNRVRRDPDNYSGKFILDGLVRANVLTDDSFNNIELRLRSNTQKRAQKTVIDIKEVEELYKD